MFINPEHPLLTHHILTAAARQEEGTLEQYFRDMIRKGPLHRIHLSDWEYVLAVPTGVGELFAYRLADHVGVRVPLVRLEADKPAESQDFCKRVPGGWVVSERVPGSIPVYFLGDACATLPYRASFAYELTFVREVYDSHVYLFFEGSINKECVLNHEFPDDPPMEALMAAQWNSPQRILGHAFRAFLYATHAHTSNCLVDTSGRLWLIDHEKIIYRENEEDIRELYELIYPSDEIMNACRLISALTESDIEEALSDIPERFWDRGAEAEREPHPPAKFANSTEALIYFAARLRVWQECFGAKVVSSHAQSSLAEVVCQLSSDERK